MITTICDSCDARRGIKNPAILSSSGSSSKCRICFELKLLDGNIVDAQYALLRAVDQRRSYFEELNRHSDPIQRLPIELATSIFTLCLPYPPSLDIFDVSQGIRERCAFQPTPFRLGSICRYWRRVVWSTPCLWNTLWLHVSGSTAMARNEMLAEWLGRTSQLPLYICMFLLDAQSDDDFTQLELDTPAWIAISSMVDTLDSYTARMKVLDLCLPGLHISRFGHSKTIPSFTAATTNNILEKLSIDCSGSFPTDDFSGFRVGGQVPSPICISFGLVDYSQVDIQWENVTVVKVSSVIAWEVLDILKLTPRIQQLISCIVGEDEVSDSYGQVTPPFLNILAITSTFGDWTLLNTLTCPALEEFSYVLNSETSASISNFFKRSACVLNSLALGVWEASYLIQVLRGMPSLTHLELLGCGIPDEFSKCFGETAYIEQKQLAGNSQDELFLPHLRSLFCTTANRSFPWFSIPSMIPQSPSTAADITMVHRPLSRVEVLLEWDTAHRIHFSSADEYVIDLASLMCIMGLVRDGVTIEIRDQQTLDLISFSQKHHGLKS